MRPGSVTPFALVNDIEHLVTPVLDAAMLDHDPLNYHPLANDRTTAVASADLLRFMPLAAMCLAPSISPASSASPLLRADRLMGSQSLPPQRLLSPRCVIML